MRRALFIGLLLAAAATEEDARVKPGQGEAEESEAKLLLADYLACFDTLPEPLRARITERWGDPERDPFFASGAFHLPIRLYGNAAVAIQPARAAQSRQARLVSCCPDTNASRLAIMYF